jgi:hypothetical protein
MNLEGACPHIQGVVKIAHAKKRECDDVREDGRAMGASAHLSDVRRHKVLRLVPNKHASRHAASSGHPVACSAEPGERWLYCYPDDVLAEY